MSQDPRVLLARRSRRSYGVFTRDEAFASGLSGPQLEDGVKRGRYEVIHAGVYVHAGVKRTRDVLEAAACRWAGKQAALSHRSALAEYGLGKERPQTIEVTTTERRCQYPPVLVHRTTYLPSHHVQIMRGRPVTDVARTLFDAGAVVRRGIVYIATEQAVRRGLTTRQQLLGRLVEHGGRGRRGCAALRQALLELDPLVEKTDSSLEAFMLKRVWSGDLPRPVCQYPVTYEGRHRRLDFAYPDLMIGIEGDGFGEHGTRDGFERDRERDADLEAMGWIILRFTWRQVRDRPDWVIKRIQQVIEVRTALFFGNRPA